MNEILIYTHPDDSGSVEVRLDGDTVWLNQQQLSDLFSTDRTSINRHIRNIYASEELDRESTCAKIAQVQKEGKRLITREIEHYNLDLILSVGYRVNSKRGTQFRRWATARLRDHLIRGFTINDKRLKEQSERLQSLQKVVTLFSQTGALESSGNKEIQGFFALVSDYIRGLQSLEDYGQSGATTNGSLRPIIHHPDITECRHVIAELRKSLKAGPRFGEETGDTLMGIVRDMRSSAQTNNDIASAAAQWLYAIIKKQPFADGNKRIGAFIFVYYLEKNKFRVDANGAQKINASGLAALALLVSKSNEKDGFNITSLIANLIY